MAGDVYFQIDRRQSLTLNETKNSMVLLGDNIIWRNFDCSHMILFSDTHAYLASATPAPNLRNLLSLNRIELFRKLSSMRRPDTSSSSHSADKSYCAL
ncbi:hypothetical protein EV356DRAFT_311677 [Viridothelium virens]|uniref:Uncharacterized protein n=1 Tax=Viridothelium virens TaxID=1048519 RepID=A0A6A6GZB3_VIRVR|nr:hypothetical protein EV356DRAFT_311677 [Viridothelium virens]